MVGSITLKYDDYTPTDFLRKSTPASIGRILMYGENVEKHIQSYSATTTVTLNNNDDLHTKYIASIARIKDECQQTLADKDAEIAALKERANNTARKTEELHKQSQATYDAYISNLTFELTELRGKINTIRQTTIDELQTKLNDAHAEYIDEMNSQDDMIANLKDQISKLHDENMKIRNQTVQSEKIRYSTEIQALIDKCAKLESKIDQTNDEHSKMLEQARANAKQEADKQLQIIQNTNANLVKTLQDRIATGDADRMRIQNTLDEHLKNNTLNPVRDGINKILHSIENPKQLTTVGKGIVGEKDVTSFMEREYPQSDITQVGDKTAMGDIMWKYNNITCLIEVKNKEKILTNDVTKFVRDVTENARSGAINCGLFVSLHDNSIPLKGCFYIEYISDIPVIYVTNIRNMPQALKICADMLVYIVKTSQQTQRQHSEIELEQIVKSISSSFNHVSKMMNTLKNLKSGLDMSVHAYESISKEAHAELSRMESLAENYPKLFNTIADTPQMDDKIVSVIVEYYNKHNKMPQSKDLEIYNIKQHVINQNGGILHLRDRAQIIINNQLANVTPTSPVARTSQPKPVTKKCSTKTFVHMKP